MSLERIVTLALLLIISLTIISVIFYEMTHSSAGADSGKLRSSGSTSFASNKKEMVLLNDSLTLSRNQLHNIYRDHTTIVAPTDSSIPKPVTSNASNKAEEIKVSKDPSNLSKPITIEVTKETPKSPLLPSITVTTPEIPALRSFVKKTALLFTMDSISSYESASKKGGAAGELLIRHSLENIFKELNVHLDVKTNDKDFEESKTASYDIVIVDPWTWAAKGWVPKHHLVGMDSKIFVLSFFGSKKLRGTGLNIPPERFLTAYKTNAHNSFLGYYSDPVEGSSGRVKKQQGVVWGKDPSHFKGKDGMLKSVADKVQLVSTAQEKVFEHLNIRWLGHQTAVQWLEILSESRFLLGLGDPLLGPSAIDAISRGCMYINPTYGKPINVNDHLFPSQHPFAAESIGEPYVCSYKMNDQVSLQNCIDKAIKTDLKPFIPKEFTKEAYRQRVIKIFNL